MKNRTYVIIIKTSHINEKIQKIIECDPNQIKLYLDDSYIHKHIAVEGKTVAKLLKKKCQIDVYGYNEYHLMRDMITKYG